MHTEYICAYIIIILYIFVYYIWIYVYISKAYFYVCTYFIYTYIHKKNNASLAQTRIYVCACVWGNLNNDVVQWPPVKDLRAYVYIYFIICYVCVQVNCKIMFLLMQLFNTYIHK